MQHASSILICGYYGFGNAGDEAILAALLADLRAVHPDATLTVLAGDPEVVRSDYGVEAISWRDVAAQVEAAEAADLMVLGGGGLFQEQQSFDPAWILTAEHGGVGYYGGFALLAAMTGKPLVVYGVGVGPLRTPEGERFTRLAFHQAAAASVRDDASAELLARIGVDTSTVAVTADPAWVILPAPAEIVPGMLDQEDVVAEGSSTVAVALRPWPGVEWRRALAEALDRLVDERDARILFVPYQQSPRVVENDANAAVEIVRLMRRHDRTSIIRGGYTPDERAALIGSADLLIAMRLHAAMAGAITGVPTVALGYDPKVAAAMALAGLEEQVIELTEATAGRIGERVASARPAEPARLDAVRTAAAANRDLFGGDLHPPEPDTETAEALAELTLRRIGRESELEARLTAVAEEHRKLGEVHRRLDDAHCQLQANYEVLGDQIRTLESTRAMRIANRYWKMRDALRDLAGRTASGGPSLLRRALRRFAPATPEEAAIPEPEGIDAELRSRIEAEIDAALGAHPDRLGVVVYPPSIGWQVKLFQRPQQMALAFARLGYVVFFGLHHPNGEGVTGVSRVADRVYLLSVPEAMTDLLEAIPEPIAVTYVYNYGWTEHLRDPKVVFEHIDELDVFTGAHSLDQLRSWYREAVAGADLVAGSARDLVRKVAADRPDAVLCPNGVDYRHFATHRPGPPPDDVADVADAGRPIIGYYGAIAEWLDFDLIRHAATALPEYEFVFIGPEYEASVKRHLSVFDLPNVRWLGVKDYRELPAYLHVFDVATIPFVVDDVTHAVSPLKLFEYFAGGRPVVTPALRECAAYEAVLIGADPDDYVAQLRRAVARRDDPEYLALLRRTARANTWEMRAGTLIDALAHHH